MSDGWFWHLLNDPVSENPWSLLLVVVTFAILHWSLWWYAGWKIRRNRRRQGFDD
jgi:hypothetical protein